MAYSISSTSKPVSGKQALLIGNNAYKGGRPLRNCINDTKDLENKLRTIDFQVTVGNNMTYEQMDRMIDDFVNKINQGDLVIFFFSGHGAQWNDQNFLVPVDDDRITQRTDIKYRAVNAQATLEKIMERRPSTAIFLLDCCRTYYLPNQAATKGSETSTGLSPMNAVVGSFIAFACDTNKTASDGSKNNRNGIFTAHLLEHIAQPNVSIDDVMCEVCDGVMTESNDRQCPFRVSSLRKKIYLNYQPQFNSQVQKKEPVQNNNSVQAVHAPYKNGGLELLLAQHRVGSKVDLSQQELIDQDMDIVVKEAIIKKRCIHLWLGSNSITSEGALILANALRNNNTLEKLDLQNNRISDEGVSFLVKTLSSSNYALKILNLGQNGITDEGARHLAHLLETNTLLTHLYLHKNDISDKGIEIIIEAMENHNKTIIELYLDDNRLLTDLSVDYLLQMIKKHPKLKRLNIQNCNLTCEGKQKLKKVEKIKRNFQVFVNSLDG